jgi:hypothetical protein
VEGGFLALENAVLLAWFGPLLLFVSVQYIRRAVPLRTKTGTENGTAMRKGICSVIGGNILEVGEKLSKNLIGGGNLNFS